jgi:hypothetical protein
MAHNLSVAGGSGFALGISHSNNSIATWASCWTASKTCSNFLTTLPMMWKVAKSWNYVNHDPFTGIVLPRPAQRAPYCFTEGELRLILSAAETGMRPGELAGLRIELWTWGVTLFRSTRVSGIASRSLRRTREQFVAWPSRTNCLSTYKPIKKAGARTL